jgi:hypothetical protein
MRVQSFSAWIHAVNTLLFLVGKTGLGGFGMVFSKPLIAIEDKTFRIRPAANVDLDLYLSAAEDDSVIPYQHITTGIKTLRGGLLKDSKNPLFWIQDRVPDELRAINPLAAPSRDRAIADGQINKAGAFDAIMIPLRTDVADNQKFQHDSFDRLIEPSAII